MIVRAIMLWGRSDGLKCSFLYLRSEMCIDMSIHSTKRAEIACIRSASALTFLGGRMGRQNVPKFLNNPYFSNR